MIIVLKTILVILLVLYGMVTGTAMTDTQEPQIIQAESGDEAMQEQLMALEGMTEAKARSIALYLTDAGVPDAAGFVLTPRGMGYALAVRAGGKQYTAVLTRGLLFRQLLDADGKIMYGVVK